MSRSRSIRKTKVIATIGPSCSSPETIGELIEAGMNVARLNFSHGSHADHLGYLKSLREACKRLSANVAVMLDTKGLEIRTGAIENGRVELEAGDAFLLHVDSRMGTREGVSVNYERLPHEVRLGSPVLLDDGHIELRVTSLSDDSVCCEVVRGGVLEGHRGVNVPESALTKSAMTPENFEDLRFAAEHSIDYVAASWVRSASEVNEIRAVLKSQGADTPIIAKIENREGVDHLEEILEAADGTMVARGDLGVEMPVQEVPLIQKRIIRSTVMSGKPVITATQMLDSMERNARPTRAEASDVANAILDGTSAVMLSGETARGLHPVEAVRTMATLARQAEASLGEYGDLQQILPHPAHVVTEAVAQAAITMADHLDAAAILTLTESGFTSRSISKYRPHCPILALSTVPEVVRKLAMNWGVTAVLFQEDGDDERRFRFGIEKARDLGIATPGDVVVATAGISRETGSTNMIRVVTV